MRNENVSQSKMPFGKMVFFYTKKKNQSKWMVFFSGGIYFIAFISELQKKKIRETIPFSSSFFFYVA